MARSAQPYLDHLRTLPFAVDVTFARPPTGRAEQVDGYVRVKTPSGVVVLAYEEKRSHLSDAIVRLLLDRARAIPNLIVFAPAVGRNIAATFEQASVNYIDLDGNCFVQLGREYIAKIQGQPRTHTQASDRALRAPALKVLFAFLAEPDLIQAPARAIASRAGGVSPQTANDVRRRLAEQGWLLESKAKWQWAPSGRRDALEAFVSGYRTTLFPSLLLGRFRSREADAAKFSKLVSEALGTKRAWRFGGGAACERLTQYYRGDKTLVYVEEMPRDLAKELRLVIDPNGPIAFARSPGPTAFASADDMSVHPLLVYADLLAENHDRARDAAREVYERFVREMEGQ